MKRIILFSCIGLLASGCDGGSDTSTKQNKGAETHQTAKSSNDDLNHGPNGKRTDSYQVVQNQNKAKSAKQPAEKPSIYNGKTTEQWIDQLEDSNALERKDAITALGKIGEPAVPALIHFIQEKVPSVAGRFCLKGGY